MFDKPLRFLTQHWWGLSIALLLILGTTYVIVWTIVEPLGIPDTIENLPIVMKSRAFYHIIFTLFFGAYATLILDLLVRKNFWSHGHNPAQPVSQSGLSFADIQRGLSILVNDAKIFQPSFIFGINRGGAIVGGYIAKQLNIPCVYILSVNCDLPSDQRVKEHRCDDQQIRGKVLLVDDAMRKGEHMREALAFLTLRYPGIIIRRMALLEMKVVHQGPEKISFHAIPLERAAFFTYDSRVMLPWDPEHLSSVSPPVN